MNEKRAGPPIELEKASVKRQKLEVKIQHAHQLRQLLTFRQDAPQAQKEGIQVFKTFLQGLSAGSQRDLTILKEYLDSQTPKAAVDDDKPTAYLSDIMEAWSFASQSNNESLLSAIPVVLAILLRTISTKIDLREQGLRLCKTLLLPQQLKLLSKSLSSNKVKEHIISPCLKLLTEIVSFDGGAFAKHVHSKHEFTLNGLARNLGLRKATTRDLVNDRKKPSVRTNAIWFLLASLNCLETNAKADLLDRRDFFNALFKDIEQDSSDIISALLNTLTSKVVLDDKLTRKVKYQLFKDWTLGRIASLYGYSLQQNSKLLKPVQVQAHEFLMLVCGDPSLGVLNSQTGWYPLGLDRDEPDLERENIDDLVWTVDNTADSIQNKTAFRNLKLSSFAQTLRPWASNLQRELLLHIFRAAPDVVANYFVRRRGFTFDPKLTSTWIGYSAFLYSTIKLPVLPFCGRAASYARRPPPVSIVIESVLPSALTQKVIAQCLSHSSALIRFIAIRLLLVAFEKLEKVLELFELGGSGDLKAWTEGTSSLIHLFSLRCPKLKDIVRVFRSTSEEEVLQREAAARLISFYYRVMPQLALEEGFDVSLDLVTCLNRSKKSSASGNNHKLVLLELEHLLRIARSSSTIRWFYKPDTLALSPFTTVLKVLVEAPSDLHLELTENILSSVARQTYILAQSDDSSSLTVLLRSLRAERIIAASDVVYQFFDNCATRFAQKPVKYLDDLANIQAQSARGSREGNKHSPSPLFMALVEQWPFVEKSAISQHEVLLIAQWITCYIAESWHAGEDDVELSAIRQAIVQSSLNKRCKQIFSEVPSFSRRVALEACPLKTDEQSGDMKAGNENAELTPQLQISSLSFDLPPRLEPSVALLRWADKEVEDAATQGHIGALILCLCSDEAIVRRQAFINLGELSKRLEKSIYLESESIALVIEELLYTVRSFIKDHPLPSYLGSFAAQAVLIQANPRHRIYPKLNKFLQAGPKWDEDKVPLVRKIMLSPPSEDDAYYEEIEWLLGVILDGLLNTDDLNAYRRSNIFESLMSLYTSPFFPSRLGEKIISIVARSTVIMGGSTTLVTRIGCIGWLQMLQGVQKLNPATIQSLGQRISDTWEHDRVGAWSDGTMSIIIGRLVSL